MIVAPDLLVRQANFLRTLTKEKAHVVDDSCNSASTLVDRIHWPHRRWIDPLTAGHCPDHFHYQPRFGASSGLTTLARWLSKQTRSDSETNKLEACAGGRRFLKGPGGDARASSTAGNALSDLGERCFLWTVP